MPSTYTPRHPQPFTLAEATGLSPPEITAEITRLQNSLKHLEASNKDLTEMEAGEEDEEDKVVWKEARDENLETIASQKERIEILRMALHAKVGVDPANPHYALASGGGGGEGGGSFSTPMPGVELHLSNANRSDTSNAVASGAEEEEGMLL